MLFCTGSNHYAVGALRQYKFLTSVLSKLENNDTACEVMRDLEKLRATLSLPKNMVIHVCANLDTLTSLYTTPANIWANFLPASIPPAKERYTI